MAWGLAGLMSYFSPAMAEIRFGYGLSPRVAPPKDADRMIALLAGPDLAARRFPIAGSDAYRQHQLARQAAKRRYKRLRETDRKGDARAAIQAVQHRAIAEARMTIVQTLLRRSLSADAFRERLVAFWADHFTARVGSTFARAGLPAYTEEAIRPHVAGRFGDMLRAAVMHPMMLLALDQKVSMGPNSPAANRRGAGRGLNENLAREVMELHTLGVNGPYTQADVRQLAELFTGMTFDVRSGFEFRTAYAEPGAETVLGRSYGSATPDVADIARVLDDLAEHPATARHLAWKLAVHFVGDAPPPDLIDRLTARYRDTGGDLLAVSAALLSDPSAWTAAPGNVKPAEHFISSACRALGLDQSNLGALTHDQVRRLVLRPLRRMGQEWNRPPGPDGWPEDDKAWITPQSLSARLQWAIDFPAHLLPVLPDPGAFVGQALGARATPAVGFAARAAESRADAIGLILASPGFQRC
ncbi:MAG: DUF1800 domain-containing protein [Rhodobacteraceae bacterium]|nr:DUF1800 domain-containing protein [Paracoccaceae bacterium]